MMFMLTKKICQFVGKKYCTIFIIKKRKYNTCKELPSKYTINGNFYVNYKLLFANELY